MSQKIEPMRLSKWMAQNGMCSRREADELIEQGLVFVDGQKITQLGSKIIPGQKVTLDPSAKKSLQEKVTILLNKPIAYVSGQEEDGYTPAIRLIQPENQDPLDKKRLEKKHFEGLAVCGRLDIDSQGLLIFTQDGVLAKKIIGQETKYEKEYLVRVFGKLSEEGMNLLRHGLILDGKPLKPAQVEWLNEDQLRFVLKEGKKRQIRRMVEAVGLQVRGLKRVRVGKVVLGNLSEGKWRFLKDGESFE